MITLNSCPVCDSNSVIKYQQVGLAPRVVHQIMPGVKVDAAILTYYSVCQNCHVIFQNPRMSDRELNKFYSEGYYRRTLNMTDDAISQDEAYRAKVDGEIIRQHLGKISSHLDIGSSHGYLLDEIGANVKVGVEPNVSDISVKGVKVYPEMDKVPKRLFDLVTAIHTLEHLPDPKGFLKEMIKKVDKDGYLIIEVPTWKSPGGSLRLPHLYHFEPDVLRMMCREAGLNVLETKFTPHLILICKLN